MYLIAAISVVVVFALAFILGGGTTLAWFVDLPSFLMFLIVIIPVLIGSGLLKDFGRAFKIGVSKKETFPLVQMKNAVCAVKLVIKTLLATAGFLSATAIVLILGNMTDLAKLGPNLSVVCMSFSYAFFFVLILLPLKARIEKKINDKLNSEESVA